MIRQAHLMVVVRAFLIGCAVLLVVGCAGVRPEAPQKEEQGSSPKATDSEEARCEGTRSIRSPMAGRGHTGIYTTNDLPGCPEGGLLLDTGKTDNLWGGEGDDEIRGLGGKDDIGGGDGNDVIYGGNGDDVELFDGKGADVIYGGDGNDFIGSFPDDQQDKLYCGKGKDTYEADKNDYVSSSCEKKAKGSSPIP